VSSWNHTGDNCHKRSPFSRLKKIYLTLASQSYYFHEFGQNSSDTGFITVVKSCRIMMKDVHCGFVDLKKLSY
jgi:hypothetical protein